MQNSNLITDLFNIQHPIIQGGMAWVSRAPLVSAVSAAGGLGVLGAGTMTPAELRSEIHQVRCNTSLPFAVNLPLITVNPDLNDDVVGALLDVIIEEEVSIVITSAGSPFRYTRQLKERGVIVAHVVPSVRLAIKAADAGVDIIVAEGIEAGGHIGKDAISTLALVSEVVKVTSVRVVAAGGIATGSGVMDALALGASGVQMGTRFVATEECNAHPKFKEAICRAVKGDTAVYLENIMPGRALKTTIVSKLLDLAAAGASPEMLVQLRGRGRGKQGCLEGNANAGIWPCGTSAALIHDVKTVEEVMKAILAEMRLCLSQD